MPPRKPPRKKAGAPLETYRSKRNFRNTPEPGPDMSAANGHSFVIQEHHARTHHFDFRLEMDGVLVSWAVPKGIPEDPAAKRLAVHVEDHPLEYGKFEGRIPAGNYGAGTVAIHDRGTWRPLHDGWRKSFANGKLEFVLDGRVHHGVFLLVRMEGDKNWLLRKLDKEEPALPAARETAGFVPPQLARVVTVVPRGEEWLHEIKFDGYRLIAVKRKGELKLYTRNELDWTDRFKRLAAAISAISPKDFVLDGEAVVFDGKGRSSFGELQAALSSGEGERIEFVAFDLLHLDGASLRGLPLTERCAALGKLVSEGTTPVRRSKVWPGAAGPDLFKQACENNLEGIISKRADAHYHPDSRREWVKSKCRARQEFVICGYTPPKGSLAGFGALLLASFEGGKLVPRGKVGTGFSDRMRMSLLETFKRLHTDKPPFPTDERNVTWLQPGLVAEVEFAEITREGSIRQGSFVALREDKQAADVHLEGVQPATTDIKGQSVSGIVISHPDRLVYPAEEITKLEVAEYFGRVGAWMLPYLAKRPIALLRAPDGITGQTFFQKSFPAHLPKHVYQKELADGSVICSIRDITGIVSLAQFGVIEFHPWGAPLPQADKPDQLVWDLDPDEAVPWPEVQGAALLLRDYLADLGLKTLLKTSGGKGLHIVLPLKRKLGWEPLKEFSRAVADAIAALNPQRFITTASKAKRRGKIFIDWLRNGKGATCIAPWSLRARNGAAVSMPLDWQDLPGCKPDGFTLRTPPLRPAGWLNLEPQLVTAEILFKLGIGKKRK